MDIHKHLPDDALKTSHIRVIIVCRVAMVLMLACFVFGVWGGDYRWLWMELPLVLILGAEATVLAAISREVDRRLNERKPQ